MDIRGFCTDYDHEERIYTIYQDKPGEYTSSIEISPESFPAIIEELTKLMGKIVEKDNA